MGNKGNGGTDLTSSRTRSEDFMVVLCPYSLHNSDHTGIVLVSKILERKDKYNTWSQAMRISLSAKDKIEFVTGSIKSPSSTMKVNGQEH